MDSLNLLAAAAMLVLFGRIYLTAFYALALGAHAFATRSYVKANAARI